MFSHPVINWENMQYLTPSRSSLPCASNACKSGPPLYNMAEPSITAQPKASFFLQMRIEIYLFFILSGGVKTMPFSRTGAPAHLAVSNGKALTPTPTIKAQLCPFFPSIVHRQSSWTHKYYNMSGRGRTFFFCTWWPHDLDLWPLDPKYIFNP